MCSLIVECVLYPQAAACSINSQRFSYKTELTIECVLLVSLLSNVFSYCRMCSLTIECVLLVSLLSNVFSYCRMCSLTVECVLLVSYYRMCSLSVECVLLV